MRIDAPNGGYALGLGARLPGLVNGVGPDEVLPAIDPLVALPPEGGLRPAGHRRRGPRPGRPGGQVELEALSGIVPRARPAGRRPGDAAARSCGRCPGSTPTWPRPSAGSSRGRPDRPGRRSRPSWLCATAAGRLPRCRRCRASVRAWTGTAWRPGFLPSKFSADQRPRSRAHRTGQHLRRAAAVRGHLGAGLPAQRRSRRRLGRAGGRSGGLSWPAWRTCGSRSRIEAVARESIAQLGSSWAAPRSGSRSRCAPRRW